MPELKRFRRNDDAASIWKALDEGRSLIEEIPADRFPLDGIATRWGGFLTDIRGFDPERFGVTPPEADLMDPRLRLLLMSVYHTLEDAGYAPGSLRESGTGLFVALEQDEYAEHLRERGVPLEAPSRASASAATTFSAGGCGAHPASSGSRYTGRLT